MMNLTLRIDRNGTTYTYGQDDILARSAELRTELQDGVVDVSDVDLVLAVDSFLGEGVPGAILELPAGDRYRAQLEGTVTLSGQTKTVTFEGSVATEDIDRDDKFNSLRVRFRNLAPERFWSALESTTVTDIKDDPNTIPGVTTRQVEATTYERQDDLGNEDPSAEIRAINPANDADTIKMARLTDVISEVLSEAGVTHSVPDEAWTDSFPTFDGQEESLESFPTDFFVAVDVGRSTQPLPNWTGRYLIEQVLNLTGWRLDVSYEAFPSAGLTAEFEHPTFIETQATEVPPWDPDSFGVATVRRGRADFALLFAENGIGEEGLNVTEDYSKLSSGEPKETFVPPTLGVYAGRRWALSRTVSGAGYNSYDRPTTGIDKAPENEDLIEVQGFKLPEMTNITKVSPLVTENTRWIGKIWYQSTPPYWRRENEDTVLLCQLDEDNTRNGQYRAIYARRPPTGIPGSPQVGSNTSSGSTSVPITTATADFRVRAGDTVQFDSHSTEYLVASDLYIGQAAAGTLELQSGLTSSLSSGDGFANYKRTAGGKDFLECLCETWARSSYRTRPADRDRARLADGRAVEPLQPSLIFGSGVYSVMGKEFAPRKTSLNLNDASTTIEVKRPAGDAPFVPAIVGPLPNDLTRWGGPTFPQGDLVNFGYLDSNDDQWYILVHWRPPLGAENRAFRYRVEVFEFDTGNDPPKTVVDTEQFGCNFVSFLGTSPTSDDGSVSGFDGSGDFQARIHTITPAGIEVGEASTNTFSG